MYEKGTALFKYPHVRDIWLAYLQHFVARYGGTKLERARDLFKQALSQVRAHARAPRTATSTTGSGCSSLLPCHQQEWGMAGLPRHGRLAGTSLSC